MCDALKNPILSLCDVSKNFVTSDAQVCALLDVSLDVFKGEFLVLLGPSGSGKSTLLHLISGLEAPTGGHITLQGYDPQHIPKNQMSIGMVFQTPILYPHMSVYDNLIYALKNKKLSRESIDECLKNMTNIFEIREFFARMPHELSGGQKQRIAIAKALIKEPAICLFDEPLSALDSHIKEKMIAQIKLLHNTWAFTAVYVTHDHKEAMQLATKIAILEKGKVIQIGTPEALHERPENLFVAEFFGASGIVMLDAKHTENTLIIANHSLPITHTIPTQAQHLILAIRPEYIQLSCPAEHTLQLMIKIQHIQQQGLLTTLTGTLTESQQKIQFEIASNLITKISAEQEVLLYFPIKKMLIYCKENGQLLGYLSDFCYDKP